MTHADDALPPRMETRLVWYEGIWDAIEAQLRVHTSYAIDPWPCACARCDSWLSLRQGLTRWMARDPDDPTRLSPHAFHAIQQLRHVRQLQREGRP